jgi:hypothetical protein
MTYEKIALRHSDLLNMLYVVLKEMRTNEHQNYAKALAQTFHGLPLWIAEGLPADEIYEKMKGLAKENNTLDYLVQLEGYARERGWKAGSYVMDDEG